MKKTKEKNKFMVLGIFKYCKYQIKILKKKIEYKN